MKYQPLHSISFETEQVFHVRSYSKSDLARLYRIDVRTLSQWIKRFKSDFDAIQYHNRCKRLSPKEVALLVDKIGEPDV